MTCLPMHPGVLTNLNLPNRECKMEQWILDQFNFFGSLVLGFNPWLLELRVIVLPPGHVVGGRQIQL
uniref:Uncharacterized protein n=2 Tax=Rhizophora mucronata TaxID=61149 RepID=A0A2P2IJQ5_RHIMU